jgi:hypothetical protein
LPPLYPFAHAAAFHRLPASADGNFCPLRHSPACYTYALCNTAARPSWRFAAAANRFATNALQGAAY